MINYMKTILANRRVKLLIIVFAVITLTAVISHGIVRWMKIETTSGNHWVIGSESRKPSVFMAGSSLAGNGLSWSHIADVLNVSIEGWAVAGSSPSEWEIFQHKASHNRLTVLVVSAYDLNEYILSDFRAELVSTRQTIKDLWNSQADWPFIKRMISQYPLTYIRAIFPTAGRSDGVMVGVREKMRKLMGAALPLESEAGPTLSFSEDAPLERHQEEKISDWDPGRKLRRIAAMRSGCLGKHSYNGPKFLAFLRMLRHAEEQGEVVVVVLPVSPIYKEEFMTQEVQRSFEAAINAASNSSPKSVWIRLDQLDSLRSNDYFWDLVHMNSSGQRVATDIFLHRIEEVSILP